MKGKLKIFQKVALSGILLTAPFFFNGCKKEEATKVTPPTVIATVKEKKPGLYIINFDGLRSDGGFSYKIGYVIEGGDSNDEPEKSAMRLFENGIELHEAHTNHQDIRDFGKGRFSHWGTTLYFSTSDNTDPVANGREYTYTLNGSGYPAN
jgi:pectate lyase